MKLPEERWVVTLKESPERTESCLEQLKLNNLEGFKMFYGYTPKQDGFYDEIDRNFVVKNRDIKPGGLGSYLSAYKLWQLLYKKEVESAWIIEDDIYFRPGWLEFIQSIPEMNYDLITFSSFNRVAKEEPNKDDLLVFKGSSVVYKCNQVYSQLSYFISRRGLKTALDEMKVITERTKDRNFAKHVLPKINSHSVYPSVCVQRAELESVRQKYK